RHDSRARGDRRMDVNLRATRRGAKLSRRPRSVPAVLGGSRIPPNVPPPLKFRSITTAFVATAAILVGALAAAIAFGDAKPLPPMASINNPFESVDYSGLPPLQQFTAKDGA